MAVRGLVIVFALIGSAAGLGYVLSSENPEQRSAAQKTRSAAPAPAAGSGTPATANPSGPSSPQPPPDDALAFMLTQVSEQYQETSRYPSYSVPLSESQAKAYRGNVYDPITLPLSDGGSFSVSLEKFRFTQGEEILVAASLSGPEVVERTMDVTLESTQDQTEEAETTLDYQADGFYEGTLESDDVPPGEYRLVVEATVDSRPLRHVSTLTIEPDLGEFLGIENPRVSGNDLVIPVEFDASESGYYALSAQLYANGQPVAHLSGEQALDGTGDQIELRAHGSVLADLADSGNVDQLQLKGLQIRRLPAQPGDRTDYAFGPEEGFTFTPPDLGSLENTRADDPESEQRAALLKKLTAGF